MNLESELSTTADTVGRIAELAREAGQPFDINGTPYLLVPQGCNLVAKPQHRPEPERIEQTITLHTAAAFIAYFKRFGVDNSVTIVDLEHARYTAIFDYHDMDGLDPVPAWCQHRAVYQCPQTPEWKLWLSHNGKAMTQTEFALFIEQNVDDIRTPPGAQMLEIVTTLKAKTKVEFSKAIRLADGNNELTYNEVIDGKAGASGQLRIPEEITLGIVPFQGGEAYAVQAKFRYRIDGSGGLQLGVVLDRPEDVLRSAFGDVTGIIELTTNQIVLHGTPAS